MAVFRIEKTRDYTVMSNYHLRDMSLSLKAKGLLSLMLSLPENWDYTMKGLARICKDGIDSISGGIRELEAHGYLAASSGPTEDAQTGFPAQKVSAMRMGLQNPPQGRSSCGSGGHPSIERQGLANKGR